MIVDHAHGMFGDLAVVDVGDKRLLLLGQQVQGGCFMDPPGDEGIRPGPVASSAYMAGWLLAGVANPNASAFMIGLGSGCGAVALLANFPGIDLTVVEIDPEMVEMATKCYPLLHHYQDAGRLQIVTADATAYMQDAHEKGDRWTLGLSDAYTGANEPVMPPDMLMGLTLVCDEVWFNCIDHPHGDKVNGIAFDLARSGHPIQHVFGTVGGAIIQNLILTTQVVDIETASAFKPYPSLAVSPSVLSARRGYARLLQTPVEILDLGSMTNP